MHKVITIDLSGGMYQISEPGYEALRSYLAHADAQLAANPDRTEIVRDLEQSIAEKFAKHAGSASGVVGTADVEQILAEIGQVDGDAQQSGGTSAGGGQPPARRLYQIREGAMLSGVCNGIAAYFNLDPTFVRLAFVVAAIGEIARFDRPPALTIGGYVVMMFLVPYAKTSSERAAAHGAGHSIPRRLQRSVERVKARFGGLHHNA